MLHVLSQAGEEGHCFLPPGGVGGTAGAAAGPAGPPASAPAVLDRRPPDGGGPGAWCWRPGGAVDQLCPAFPGPRRAWRNGCASCGPNPWRWRVNRVQRWMNRFVAHTGLELSPGAAAGGHPGGQWRRLLILTGGPGCGRKTFTTRTMVALWRAMGKTVRPGLPHRSGHPTAGGGDRTARPYPAPPAGV
jgi:exodeoxyribonuclease V alpha subunit